MVRKQLLENIKNLPIKQQKKIINTAIDIAVKMYQESQLQEDFDLIKELYPPFKYVNYWKSKYGHLCDNNIEDFKSEYMLCFVKACNFYKKDFDNTQKNYYFNKYFFSVVGNYFKNKMSKMSCHKRNPSIKCPLCDKSVAPLNTHILKDHQDLVKQLVEDYHCVDKCPFCTEILDGEILYKHIASKHSSNVFDYFKTIFPNYKTTIQDPAPPMGLIYIGDEELGSLEDTNAKPLYYEEENSFENIIFSNNFSECQKTIKNIFNYYNISKLPSYKKLCSMCLEMNNCAVCPRGTDFKMTKNIYNAEIEDLKNKIQ